MSDALPTDPAELRAMTAALEVENARLAATLRAHDLLIEALQARIGPRCSGSASGRAPRRSSARPHSSSRPSRTCRFAAAEGDTAEPGDPDADASVSAGTEVEAEEPAEAPKPRRRPRVAEGTPRERRVLAPGEACPDCGGDLRVVGEDVSELVELIAARLKVIGIARPKASCRRCERMVQAPAPSRPIPREPWPGPGCWPTSSSRSAATTFCDRAGSVNASGGQVRASVRDRQRRHEMQTSWRSGGS